MNDHFRCAGRAESVRLARVLALLGLPLAACSSGLEGPRPSIEGKGLAVEPAIVCRDQLTTTVTVHGRGFSPVPIDVPSDPRVALPSVSLLRGKELDGKAGDGLELLYSGDPDVLSNVSALRWLSQEELRFTIDQQRSIAGEQALIPAGVYDIRVKNPNDNSDQLLGALAVVEKPRVSSAEPPVVCIAQGARELSLTGSTLLGVEGQSPTLKIQGRTAPLPVKLVQNSCTRVAHPEIDAKVCTQGTVTLAQGAVPDGFHAMTLKNPETAACHSEEDLGILVVPPPVIDAVDPVALCNLDGTQKLTVRGSGFLEIDGKGPRLSLAGKTITEITLAQCEAREARGASVRSCNAIELELEVSQFELGDVPVTVENPEPAGCSGSATAVFRIVGPPTITSIAPSEICDGVQNDLTIRGTGFDPLATVTMDSAAAESVNVESAEQLVATFARGLAVGTHSVTVTNVGSCAATASAAVTVDPSPIVFFVDPPVIFSEIPVELTIFTSGLAADATKVELVHESGARQVLTDFDSPQRPNKILAKVPAGLASGKWDVYVTNAGGCPGYLEDGLTVSDTLDAALLSTVSPSFVSPTEPTAVTVAGSGFLAIPRLYLTPAGGSSGAAVALSAVNVQSATQLTAVVPGGLTAGEYDLIVVNPDGKVDVLDSGVTVTPGEPPVITSVAPGSLPSGQTGKVTVLGSGFDPTGVEVALDCLVGSSHTVVAGAPDTPAGSGDSVGVTFVLPSLGAGTVCIVKLTNGDGSFFEFSAFSITTASLNLSSWQPASAMTTARRAPSLVAGRPTATTRYLYALGGDSGVTNAAASIGSSVFATTEAARVDVYGNVDGFSAQRNQLPAARTWAGAATIGHFVYLVGGHDGNGATSSLFRAQILDPLAGPELTDLDATLGDGSQGLTGGLYYYRVAALFPSDDPANPGGEGLAGELLPVQLPERTEKIKLSLSWEPVANAHGYRLYRTPSASGAADQLELVGEVVCGATASDLCDCLATPEQCTLADAGAATNNAVTPMPGGSLGVWHAVNGPRCTSGDCLLDTPREAHATVAIRDPGDSNTFFLYAFGGRNGATYLDTYELATVTLGAGGLQTVADFVKPAGTLTSPRAELGAWVMDKANVSKITDDATWVYLGGGRTSGGTITRDLAAAELNSDGTLGTIVTTNQILKADLTGFGAGAANGQLYTFGGQGSSAGSSGELCTVSSAVSCLPDFDSASAFNSLGNAATDRQYMGATQESAFFFLAGGHDGNATLSSTQQTVQ